MNYVMLALAGILSGGIVFGAKILFMSGATLFEVMLFPNLIGAALFTPFVVKEFKRFIGVPPVITLLFTLSVLLVNVGDYVVYERISNVGAVVGLFAADMDDYD